MMVDRKPSLILSICRPARDNLRGCDTPMIKQAVRCFSGLPLFTLNSTDTYPMFNKWKALLLPFQGKFQQGFQECLKPEITLYGLVGKLTVIMVYVSLSCK
jgi:hypothetical protein